MWVNQKIWQIDHSNKKLVVQKDFNLLGFVAKKNKTIPSDLATPDVHYSEFDGRPENSSPSPTDNNHSDDYAEFEPHHTDEIYHEAAIESSSEPIFSETHTIRGETTEANTYYQQGSILINL